jgi:DNA-directed RNA polymerase II subunit RPB2
MDALDAAEQEYLLRCWTSYIGPVRHQLDSFNSFCSKRLHDILAENSEVKVECERRGIKHHFTFGSVVLRPPTIREADGTTRAITPQECRLRNVSYLLSVYVNVRHVNQQDGERRSVCYEEVLLCRIPCMIGSCVCNLAVYPSAFSEEDPLSDGCGGKSGIFVISGVEKVIVMQERLRPNYPFVRRLPNGSFVLEIRSLHFSKTRSTSTMCVTYCPKSTAKTSAVLASLPFLDCAVPLATLCRLLGVESRDLTLRYLEAAIPACCRSRQALMEFFARVICEDAWASDLESVMESIGRLGSSEATAQKRIRYVQHIISCETLPSHGLDGSPESSRRKLAYLCHALVKLMRVALGELPEDDRDNYAIKRVDDAGMLFALLFRQLFRGFLKSMTLQVHKLVEAGKSFSAFEVVNHRRITLGFKYAMATGNWGVLKQSSQNGVAQVLTRQNLLASISHRRRINTPVNREGKLPKPRELSLSHYGIICPVETPEGQACGLVENLAFLALVRDGVEDTHLVKCLRRHGLLLGEEDGDFQCSAHWKVLVNGTLAGSCRDGEALCAELRRLRRSCQLPACASIYHRVDEQTVSLDCDAGCLLRPLVRCDALPEVRRTLREVSPPLVWRTLISQGLVELIDKAEEANLRLGATHLEVHPSCMLGVCAAQIPFSNHNQAPRNIYEAAMTKQAIGTCVLDMSDRVDAMAHALLYPQVPLVQTLLHAVQGSELSPCGVNVVVAICTYTGFSQEDAIIFNRGSLDRGLFRSFCYRTWKDEEYASTSHRDTFGRVPTCAAGRRSANYEHLDADGLPGISAQVGNDDVILGKVTIHKETAGKRASVVDSSTVLRSIETWRVDAAYAACTRDGARLSRLRLRSLRVPQVGDKFSSHHGQKGVIGLILDEADMPYTASGMVPDLLISPFSVPSRMTVGQLCESLLGKVCCLTKHIGNGTPFEGLSVDEIGQALSAHGYERRGNETLFNGLTGEHFATSIFVGPTHYQRLKHCVVDKVHGRSTGPTQILTRQPVEGRSRNGGTRIGEMERDVLIAHGASALLVERLMKSSDEYTVPICRRCGFFALRLAESLPVVGSRLLCRNCDVRGDADVALVTCPYAFKLLVQEIAALGVSLRLGVGDPEA